MRKDTIKNVIKIVKCLQEAKEWMWIRQISRRTNLHHKTVSRLIDRHLSMFIEEQNMEPFNLRFIRLKSDVDMNKILRFISVMKKISK